MNSTNKVAAPQLGESVKRIDGVAKAVGSQVYPSDQTMEGMLKLRILRSAYPHANIVSIDTSNAEKVPGVVGVFTAKDIPGENGVGVNHRDEPVLCDQRVRCVGDALAVIAADTDDAAARALELVEVEYELLPVVTDAHKAMQADAPKVHPNGNILQEFHSGHGDVETAFAAAEHIFESEYITGRQEHLPLETEAGVAYYGDDGRLTVSHGGQAPHRDQVQIADVLGLPEQDVRVITPMVGGSFGGKDDFNVQCYLALATYLTKRPCYIMLDRSESISITPKRHPFSFKYKIACDAAGKLLAGQIKIVADTGAYASWGDEVMYVCMAQCFGPYHIPNVKIDAYCVFTNNCVSGAFRGFGGMEGSVGIESEMDRMACKLGFDPFEFRRQNGLSPGQLSPGGFTFNATRSSFNKVLNELELGPIYSRYSELKAASGQNPWKKRGVGVASTWMCNGFGHGTPDSAEAQVDTTGTGGYRLLVGGVDMGQGNATMYAQIVSQVMNCPVEQVEVHIGDSAGPDSGACDSVRSSFIINKAVERAAQDLRKKLVEKMANALGCIAENIELLGRLGEDAESGSSLTLAEMGELSGKGVVRIYQENPEDNTEDYGAWVFTFGAQAALVEVDLLTGKVDVLKIHSVIDAGKVMNRQGFEAQSEGGIVQSLGFALMEDCQMEDGRILNHSLSTYVAPYIKDVPDEIITTALEDPAPETTFGARGIAEAVMCPTPPAILNAVHDALGERFTRLPLTSERVIQRLSNAN